MKFRELSVDDRFSFVTEGIVSSFIWQKTSDNEATIVRGDRLGNTVFVDSLEQVEKRG